MTREQLHIAFKIAMDKNATNIAFGSYPAFLPEEIDYWLNQGMYQEISNKFTGNNSLQQPFEQTTKRVHDLEKLIVTKVAVEHNDITSNVCAFRDIFKDKMFFVDGVFRFGAKEGNILLVSHDKAKKFRQTYDNIPYIPTPVATIEGNDLLVYYDPVSMKIGDKDGKYYVDITYIKNPTKVEDLGENDMTEFPEYMQHEVVNRAVMLALSNIESQRTQTQSQINQLDE